MARRTAAVLIALLSVASPALAQTVSPESWMGDLKPQIGHIPLNHLAIPGTHDAGTASIDPFSTQAPDSFAFAIQHAGDVWLEENDLGILTWAWDAALDAILNPTIYKWAVAQDQSIAAQLRGGIRYFDLRFCKGPGLAQISICHSLYGESDAAVLYAVRDFSLQHPDEIIILDFSHLTGEKHGIEGPVGVRFATSIVTILNGMLIPRSVAADATLDDIWNRSAMERIVVLYDDPDMSDAVVGGAFWPGQKVPAGSAIGGEARVFSPWPATEFPAVEKAAAEQYLQCRCGYTDPDPGLPFVDAADKLFVLQTNTTPSTYSFVSGFIGGSLIGDIKDNIADIFLGACPFGFCEALDSLANGLGYTFGPRNLRALANETNLAFFGTAPTVSDWVTANGGALRDKLNIVQADMFEHRYHSELVRFEVPSQFVDSMVALNLAPEGTLAVGSPSYPANSDQPFVRSDTPFTISPSNPSAWGLGVDFGSYQVDPSRPVTYMTQLSPFTGPFTINSWDGEHSIHSRVTNLAGVKSRTHVQKVTLDNTPPAITVAEPHEFHLSSPTTAYTHTSTLTLNYGITDDVWQGVKGSGVQSVAGATIDGSPIVTDVLTGAQHGLSNGQQIKLLTELPLGYHTFTFGGASDNVGNRANSTSVTFKVISTLDSIEADLAQFIANGGIGSAAWAQSLRDKMDQAAAARAAGRYSVAASIYNSLINDLAAHGINASAIATGIITEDAEYLTCTLPMALSTPAVLSRTDPLLLSKNDALFRNNDPFCKSYAR